VHWEASCGTALDSFTRLYFYIMVPDRETCSETNAFAAVTCVKVARTPLPQSSVSSDVLMRADTLRTLGNLAANNANTQPMWARTGQLILSDVMSQLLSDAPLLINLRHIISQAYKERRRSALTPPNPASLIADQPLSLSAIFTPPLHSTH
jgi:hypothetical protein